MDLQRLLAEKEKSLKDLQGKQLIPKERPWERIVSLSRLPYMVKVLKMLALAERLMTLL
jgi:hypothetical protein